MNNSINKFDRLMQDYLKGTITPADMQIMNELLQQDTYCRKKYREMVRIYAITSAPRFEQRKQQNLEFLRKQLNLPSKHCLFKRIKVWSFAAIIAVLICLNIYFIYWNNDSHEATIPPISYCQIEIPLGAQSKLILPDSTLVYLNGGTTIKYDASFQDKTKREVFLSGEAYFEVTKDIEKPFIVHAAELDINVLGTKFNVSSYLDEPKIKVSLVEGKVNVSMTSDKNDECYLLPDEQAVYNKAEGSLSVREIDANAQTVWTTGRLAFVNETLSHILKIIEKKYDVQILIQSQKMNTEYFSGNIDTRLTLNEILSYLDVDNKFIWKRKGKTLIISDRQL